LYIFPAFVVRELNTGFIGVDRFSNYACVLEMIMLYLCTIQIDQCRRRNNSFYISVKAFFRHGHHLVWFTGTPANLSCIHPRTQPVRLVGVFRGHPANASGGYGVTGDKVHMSCWPCRGWGKPKRIRLPLKQNILSFPHAAWRLAILSSDRQYLFSHISGTALFSRGRACQRSLYVSYSFSNPDQFP